MAEHDDLPERMVRAIAMQLIRNGTLTIDDIAEAATIAEREDDDGELAHQLRCLFIEANVTPKAEFEADRRRARMHLVPPDGGNPQPE